jgi:hypothetical protein
MKTFIVEVRDESKTEFVETLLGQLDGVVYEEKLSTKKKKEKGVKKEKGQKGLFENSAGMWEGRDLDAKKLREMAWSRGGNK